MLAFILKYGTLILWIVVTGITILTYLIKTNPKKNNTLYTYPLFGIALWIGVMTTGVMTLLIWLNNFRELQPDNSAEGFAYTLETLKPVAITAAGFLAILGLIASQYSSMLTNQQIQNAQSSLDQSKRAYELSAYYSFKEDFIETADKKLASENFTINTSLLFKLIYPNIGQLTPNSSEGSIIVIINSLWEACSKKSEKDTDCLSSLLAELYESADFQVLKNETDITLMQQSEIANNETLNVVKNLAEEAKLCGVPGSKLLIDHLQKFGGNCAPTTNLSALFTDMKIMKAGDFASKVAELIFSFCPNERPEDLPTRESGDKPGIGSYFINHKNWNRTLADLLNEGQVSATKEMLNELNGEK